MKSDVGAKMGKWVKKEKKKQKINKYKFNENKYYC